MLALRELGGDVPVSQGLPISFCASHLESGLRIARSLGDRASEAHMLSRLAIIAANRLRLDAALDYGLRAVAAGRAAADDQALAAGLDGLKLVYLSLGDTGALADVIAELDPLLRRLVTCSGCSGRISRAASSSSPRRTWIGPPRPPDRHRAQPPGRLPAPCGLVRRTPGLARAAARPRGRGDQRWGGGRWS